MATEANRQKRGRNEPDRGMDDNLLSGAANPISVIPVSFTPKRYLSMPEGEWSLRHYEVLISGGWLSSIGDSLLVAICSALLALAMGTLFAVGHWRLNNGVTRNLRLLLLLPMIVPPIVHAVAFYQAWSILDLLDTYFGLILVYTTGALPFVVLSVTGKPGQSGHQVWNRPPEALAHQPVKR